MTLSVHDTGVVILLKKVSKSSVMLLKAPKGYS